MHGGCYVKSQSASRPYLVFPRRALSHFLVIGEEGRIADDEGDSITVFRSKTSCQDVVKWLFRRHARQANARREIIGGKIGLGVRQGRVIHLQGQEIPAEEFA